MEHNNIFPNDLKNEVRVSKNGSLFTIEFPSKWDRINFRNMFYKEAYWLFGEYSVEFAKEFTKDMVIDMAKQYIKRYNLIKVIDNAK